MSTDTETEIPLRYSNVLDYSSNKVTPDLIGFLSGGAPGDDYVLLRAIVPADVSAFGVGGGVKDAIANEIIAVGENARAKYKPGQHCMHMSAAGDPLDPSGKGRYWMVHLEDLGYAWWPDAVQEAIEQAGGLDAAWEQYYAQHPGLK